MAFWSTEKINAIAQTWELVKPFDPGRLDCGSYHLAVGPEVFVTSTGGTKKTLEAGQQLTIPAGQLAILVTEEVVHVPHNAIGFISMRASVKLGGLVNVSGFHVDPGYKARLKFSVYNAGDQPAVLMRGDPIFLIWFADLDQATADTFSTDAAKHGLITSADVARLQGTMPTPTALKAEVDQIRNESKANIEQIRSEFDAVKERMKSWRFWLATAVVAIVTSVVSGVVVWLLTRDSHNGTVPGPTPTASVLTKEPPQSSAPPVSLPSDSTQQNLDAGSATPTH